MSEKQEPTTAVTPTRPRALRDMRQEFARMWDSMFEPGFGWRRTPAFEAATWPAVDVFEKDGSVIVKADIPGMEATDIEVSTNDDGVTISGHRLEEKEVNEKDYHRSERSYGRFVRQVALPAGADREKGAASFKDGVLEITFPLSDGAKQKKIEVKSS